MTAPQLIERNLTFTFAQSVSITTGQPDILSISVIPLSDTTNVTAGASYAGGLKTQEIELSGPSNQAVFQLLPSNAAGNTTSVNYRVLWRAGPMARTFTYDFAMPDTDITWEDLLAGSGNIIDGETYLQQSDLGVAGRVARLNSSGAVVDAFGVPVAVTSQITTVQNNIDAEANARVVGDTTLQNTLQSQLTAQIATVTSGYQSYANSLNVGVSADLTTERGQRISVDAGLQTQINTNLNTLNGVNSTLYNFSNATNAILNAKADLVSGQIPTDQIPDTILTNAFPVANQSQMLALTYPTVHKGDLAVRPDGVWLLTTNDPTQLGNWVSLTTVSMVNGYRGVVTLSASDVGAIPVGGAIAQAQVTGLSTALSTKANQADLVATNVTVAGLQTDQSIVRTSPNSTPANTIPSSLLDSSVVYLNQAGQLVHKDGSIIPLGAGSSGAIFSVNGQTGIVVLTASSVGAVPVGGSVTQSQVTGLSTVLGLKANQADLVTTNTVVSQKADLVSGLVPLGEIPMLPQSQITGLNALITDNQLTTSTNAINRVASLEGAVATLGATGNGSMAASSVPFYTDPNTTTVVTNLATVILHSPWGIDSDGTITGTIGTWYYLYTGVRSTDVAYPYISQNGHLQLHKWNEAGPADPVYALASDLATTSTQVAAKANQTDLNTANALIATKADTTTVTTLSGTVDGLVTSVALKANQTDLTATNNNVALKINSSDVAATYATIASLTATNSNVTQAATLSQLATTNSNVAANTTALTTKADLTGVGGTLKANQVPTNIPLSSIYDTAHSQTLTTTLAAKADLTSGVLSSSQIPTNIPTTSVFDGTKNQPLSTTLGAKADLVGGVVPLSQVPAGALPNVQQVSLNTDMTALTAAEVQPGDLCIVSNLDTMYAGTYILSTSPGHSDPSILGDWIPLNTGTAPVLKVNNKTGNVTLSASDVGAIATGQALAASSILVGSALDTQVNGVNGFVTQNNFTSGLGTKTGVADVHNQLYWSSWVKRADYVATSTNTTGTNGSGNVNLVGPQTIDGRLTIPNALVLLTAQSDKTQNGLWVAAASGTGWNRAPDYNTGNYVAQDMIVMVSYQIAGGNGAGNASNDTIWQVSLIGTGANPGGSIGTDLVFFTQIGNINPQYSPTQGNGVSITPSTNGGTFAAVAASGGGISVASGGISVDTTVARKYVGLYHSISGSTVTVQHNLNTLYPSLTIWDTSTNPHTLVTAGATATDANNLSIEFVSVPTSSQYQFVVVG